MIRISQGVLLVAVLATAVCAQPAQQGGAGQPGAAAPTLVVFFTVDQMRPDYFTLFESQLTGGLARLYRGGAVFTNAFQDHAITETAPGHASTMSGRFPRSTGIVQNTAGVGEEESPLINAIGPGASPNRFRGTVLTDWLLAKNARTRALSVSGKDRGAILPLGKVKQGVFWYTASGRFTTSTYYADTLPTWVNQFNAQRIPMTMAGRSWTPLLDATAYSEPDSVPAENLGSGFLFPHVLSSDTAVAASTFWIYPWMDELTLQVALAGVNALALGAGPQTDMLAISLSATDYIGHRYGPDSRELHDQIVRLDRYLGAFLDSLYKVRDSTRVIIALTADHGVAPSPLVHSRYPNQGARHFDELRDTLLAARARVIKAGVDSTAFAFRGQFLVLNHAAFSRAKVSADSVARDFAATMRRLPSVLRADVYGELARADTTKDTVARRWLHMFPADEPPDVVVTLHPYHYWYRGITATHGTPHDYDAHVPVIFYGPPFKQGKYGELARVVDMAPTLAAVLKATPTERLDGRVLRSALR